MKKSYFIAAVIDAIARSNSAHEALSDVSAILDASAIAPSKGWQKEEEADLGSEQMHPTHWCPE